jgi:hypothetical protein
VFLFVSSFSFRSCFPLLYPHGCSVDFSGATRAASNSLASRLLSSSNVTKVTSLSLSQYRVYGKPDYDVNLLNLMSSSIEDGLTAASLGADPHNHNSEPLTVNINKLDCAVFRVIVGGIAFELEIDGETVYYLGSLKAVTEVRITFDDLTRQSGGLRQIIGAEDTILASMCMKSRSIVPNR